MTSEKVDAIIPVYNESKKILGVVSALIDSPMINNIIVVDDASTDDTADLVSHLPRVVMIKNTHNVGKGGSVSKAVKLVTTNKVFICDGDLNNFTSEICEKIILALDTHSAGMSVGLRDYGFFNWVQFGFPISGERAMLTAMLKKCAESHHFSKFNLEIVMNYYCNSHGLKIFKKIYPYTQTLQFSKINFLKGLKQYLINVYQFPSLYIHYYLNGWH